MGPEVIRQGKAKGKGLSSQWSDVTMGEEKMQASSVSSAAKHTYDRSQERWEKFDADAALAAIDAEEEGEEEEEGEGEGEGKLVPPRKVSSSKRKGGEQRLMKPKGSGHGSVGGSKGGQGSVDSASRTSGGHGSSGSDAKRERNKSVPETAPSKEHVSRSASSASGLRRGGIAAAGAGAGAVIGGGRRTHTSSDEAVRRSALPLSHGKPTKNGFLEDGGPAAVISRLADAADFDDSLPDAASEKDRGNDLFRQGRFGDAIDCYSRSIALRPTCIAYANRAMALLKLKRFKEAEEDCTEALELDDMYVKAYARRGSARKELKKYGEAAEDLEYALQLEPENKELRQQLQSVLPFCEKEGGKRISPQLSSLPEKSPISLMGASSRPADFTTAPLSGPLSMLNSSSLQPSTVGDDASKGRSTRKVLDSGDLSRFGITELTPEDLAVSSSTRKGGGGGGEREVKAVFDPLAVKGSAKKTAGEQTAPSKTGRMATATAAAQLQQAVAGAEAIAARAAAAARETLAKKVGAPKTAYEFENVWKMLADDRQAQARVLRMVDPSTLPKTFKDALSAHLLCDIIAVIDECLLKTDDAARGIDILEKLTTVGRFDITIMFLSAQQKAKLRHLWEGSAKSVPISSELQDRLQSIRAKYRV
ncbi:hypothetical protein CBR_g18648 [Chara braunii]|uniref:RNA-polymerase II-associated protein 3-like C-terminal domain-containing protein n=1 Tax=Chara braunii TaxID=69332 RepID=A0A388JTC2_CHABU|nr:hypothetical protein CBR_g18648 [Chara braunii]|eukprot:GBG61056.1 hypothetical protein CBR_g18648 [Chara braunii]